MSKSLLTAKLIGGGILGTGAVAAGGYGIVEHFRSKEESTSEQPTQPANVREENGNLGQSAEEAGSSDVPSTQTSIKESSPEGGGQTDSSRVTEPKDQSNPAGSVPSSSEGEGSSRTITNPVSVTEQQPGNPVASSTGAPQSK